MVKHGTRVVIADPKTWPKGIDVNVNWKLLHACTLRHRPLAREAVSQGADVNCRRKDYLTPLHIAAEHNDVDIIQLLCSQPSIDVEIKTLHGLTPLHMAAFLAHVEALKKLLENGASVDCTDHLGRSPLHYAAFQNDVEGASVLLKHDANVNVYDVFHESPLYMSVARGSHFPMIKLLLRHGAMVTSSSEQLTLGLVLETVLSVRIMSDMTVLDLLFRNVDDVNATDFIGLRTPMHIAAMTGNLLLAVYLIKKGADLHRTNRAGRTPMDVALMYKNFEIVKLIERALSKTTELTI